MTLLVTGGRAYHDRAHVFAVLDELHARRPVTRLLEGGAEGADASAQLWAKNRSIEFITFKAEWDKHHYRAGPIRNSVMLVAGRPNLVLAFPGGKGTADMVRKAKAAGVEVVVSES